MSRTPFLPGFNVAPGPNRALLDERSHGSDIRYPMGQPGLLMRRRGERVSHFSSFKWIITGSEAS